MVTRERPMRLPYKSVAGTIALTAAAFAVIHWRSADQPASAPAAVSPVPVVTAQGQQHDEPIILSGLGTVQALNAASIQSQVTGVLEEVDFVEGQSVKKGDFLAKIDPRLYQAALTQAQGQLARDTALHAQAQSDLERYQKLGREDSIALQQIADQQFLVAQDAAAMETDQGVIKSDQTHLDYTTLIGWTCVRTTMPVVLLGWIRLPMSTCKSPVTPSKGARNVA